MCMYPAAVDSHTNSEECDADSDDGNEIAWMTTVLTIRLLIYLLMMV